MRIHCFAGRTPAAASIAVATPSQTKLAQRAKELSGVLELFPSVQHAFAYGSGIFVQPGLYTANSQTARPMLDFMLAVESPVEWHQQVICS